ncbi:heavy-metal-associated domain-containing protein [Agrobacterium sp.]|uniref:heavy-metal-associated domain-containing protein n=1 Tax=Agrobacterium sp. TaxID=361 RepID=UPI002896E368|nr:heavy-metal-associated domain-containing protein [Agrobacterium sp.]
MIHLNVPDMTCGHCVGAVEKAVRSVDPEAKIAVDPEAKIAVDLEAKTASIESTIGAEAFIAAIEDAGYGTTFKKSCCSHVA